VTYPAFVTLKTGPLYQSAATGLNGLMVLWSEVEPADSGGEQLYSLLCEDSFALVISGSIDVIFSNESFKLNTGDAMTWKSQMPHTFRNHSQSKPAVVIFIMTPAPR
jgi:uncharacterized cupin superfamily protein